MLSFMDHEEVRSRWKEERKKGFRYEEIPEKSILSNILHIENFLSVHEQCLRFFKLSFFFDFSKIIEDKDDHGPKKYPFKGKEKLISGVALPMRKSQPPAPLVSTFRFF